MYCPRAALRPGAAAQERSGSVTAGGRHGWSRGAQVVKSNVHSW
jgi:hypothetical protein